MKSLLFIAALLVAGMSYGLETYLTLENDTFITHADNDYTHGTGLEVIDDLFHYKLGQNMYAPSDLTKSYHIKGDRPYCGMLYGGVGYEFFKDPESPWTHYAELDMGIIGPGAMCKDTQTAIHKLLGCRKPMGWDNQLHNEFVVNGQWWTKYNWYLCDYVALVPRAGLLVGTVQDAAEVGCDLKVGWNMRRYASSGDKESGNTIMFSAPSGASSWYDKLSAWIFAGVGERYYLYNHILEGSLFNNKDDPLGVSIERFVSEFRFGVVAKYDRFYFGYYGVLRTDEFKHQKNAPNYGGICVGWTW